MPRSPSRRSTSQKLECSSQCSRLSISARISHPWNRAARSVALRAGPSRRPSRLTRHPTPANSHIATRPSRQWNCPRRRKCRLGLPPNNILPALSKSSADPARDARPGKKASAATDRSQIPFVLELSEGAREFDLSRAEDRSALRAHLFTEPMTRVVAAYAQLRALEGRHSEARNDLQGLRASLTWDGKTRGFLPKENRLWAECLHHTRNDPWNILGDPELARENDGVDIRCLVQDLYGVDQQVSATLEKRLTQLVPECWRAIDHALSLATGRALNAFNEHLQLAIVNTRAWLYKLAYRIGIDLHPDLTREYGRMVTPDEYCDQYLVLARKAERAAGAPDLDLADPQPRSPEFPSPKVASVTHPAPEMALLARRSRAQEERDAFLRYCFDRRLTMQIAGIRDALVELENRNPTSFLQEHALHDERKRHLEKLGTLQDRLEAFRKAPDLILQRARAIDYLPPDVTDEELSRNRGKSHNSDGPDAATRMLEDMLQRIWAWPDNDAVPDPGVRKRRKSQMSADKSRNTELTPPATAAKPSRSPTLPVPASDPTIGRTRRDPGYCPEAEIEI